MPAYIIDPYMYKMHRMKGGTFQNFSGKHYQALTDDQISKHLNAEQLVGLYPLLPDNTSWFIAADFDEANWVAECRQCLEFLNKKEIPAYLERSRSGKGGHIWIFFESSYPAFQSRVILSKLLEESGVFSMFDKHSSFDRLFPNQDYLSGKGLGNLIALPLHKLSLELGNSCFVNPETLEPFPDQWEFLRNIKRVPIDKLEGLFQHYSSNGIKEENLNVVSGKLQIHLRNAVYINRSGLTTPLINFVKEELNFANTEFFVKKNMNRNTFGTQRYFKLIEETKDSIIIPKGFIGKLIRFCREQNIRYDFEDERRKSNTVSFSPTFELREYQKPALEAALKKDFGVIVAPPGAGKTIIGLSIISKKHLSALIIVHRKQLAEQWAERVESFLGIPKKDIGRIGQGKHTIGKQVTIAMIQSLEKTAESEESEKYFNAFGTIIVDECHHVPSETYRNALSKFHSFYTYGLTATPFRKYNDGKLIFIYLGDIISEIKPLDISKSAGAKVIVRNSDLFIPYNFKTDKFETLSKVLIHDSTRNKLILEDVISELDKGKKAVIITERKEHIDTLFQYLKQKYEAITLSGEDNDANKAAKWKLLHEGNFQVLITTGQYFGEGSDLQKIECLFIVYPFSFEGKLIQYIGRVQRSEITPVIYDYRDHKIDYLETLFQKRNVYYKNFYLHGTLFDKHEEEKPDAGTFIYEERIKIPIQQLEFKYGIIGFKHLIPENNTELEFELENTEIRPEFDILKPYFAKVLKTKLVKIDVTTRFVRGVLIHHSAVSNDLKRINREIIDSVKFQFISKSVIGRVPANTDNLLDLNRVQDNALGSSSLYNSENELLDDILKNRKVKHAQQLVYLSQRHESTILKLRFVLSPFSFVFLLSGKQYYYIVWETLDSEEATYIWHIEKNLNILKAKLKQVDLDIGKIRIEGRQRYLERNHHHFTRVTHDYTDERKGFIIWKDVLEERLV